MMSVTTYIISLRHFGMRHHLPRPWHRLVAFFVVAGTTLSVIYIHCCNQKSYGISKCCLFNLIGLSHVNFTRLKFNIKASFGRSFVKPLTREIILLILLFWEFVHNKNCCCYVFHEYVNSRRSCF